MVERGSQGFFNDALTGAGLFALGMDADKIATFCGRVYTFGHMDHLKGVAR